MNPNSATETHLRKRTRTDNGLGDEKKIDKICEELWFEDGNVVIASVETSRHLFKVHKSVLSTHSLVLRDLFALPQPIAAVQTEDTYNGLPLVDFPDSPDDVRDLLVALYYPTKLVCRRNRRSTFKKVTGVLRLATKYEISALRNHIRNVLDLDWPSTFEAWETNEFATNDMIGASEKRFTMASKLPNSSEIINLARECRITSILPAAFYNIARIQESDEFDGYFKHDYLNNACYRKSEMDDCSSDDLVRIIVGRESLRRHSWDIYRGTRTWLYSECAFEEDERRERCHLKLKEWWTKTAGECLFVMEDLLGALRMIIGTMDEDLSNEVCLECRRTLVGRMKEQQQEIWGLLPIYFRLEAPPKVPKADPMDSESDE
ncbi:hypothetical protein BD410DRAFT_741816 [Rickenella mellea]|uniref:BTB domain-containing protein n=1 Tax=Rickenella mellea TaxID=50990 RepID=A0A4Y7QGW7_9AGAM|nr:hypothetical protein BD410DRAFT_741816 [Rickenella mellea]